MKKTLVLCLLLCMAVFVFAEDDGQTGTKVALSLGPEWNMNSRDNFAAGAVLSLDFMVGSSLALGYNVTISTNFSDLTVIEPATFLRWYFLKSFYAGDFAALTGLFIQPDIGAYLFFDKHYDDVTPMFLGGLRAGVRLPLSESFFIEPYGRLGYPFTFGVGVMMGVRFPKQAAAEKAEELPVINR